MRYRTPEQIAADCAHPEGVANIRAIRQVRELDGYGIEYALVIDYALSEIVNGSL